MVDYSQLMSGVLVAATTFLGLTLVFLGQLNKTNDVNTEKELRRRQRLGWSFLLGVLVVFWVILWLANGWVWGTLLATIVLIFQIGLLIPEVSPFLIIRKH
jgi:hypothetical protein